MCPFYPVLVILLILLAIPVARQQIASAAVQLKVTYDPFEVKNLKEGEFRDATYSLCHGTPGSGNLGSSLVSGDEIYLQIRDQGLLDVSNGSRVQLAPSDLSETCLNASFTLRGVFLGRTSASLHIVRNQSVLPSSPKESLEISVIRKLGFLDDVFIVAVVSLVCLSYVTMGCSIDLQVVKDSFRVPRAPLVGLALQYIYMPLMAYAMAYAFLDKAEDKLGLFVTGCSPGGGASNMWTSLLGGNLSLSISLTFICTLAEFLILPLWTVTLGKTIFDEGNIQVPYRNIGTLLVGLVVPIAAGLALQRWAPRLARILVKIMRPFFLLVILVIVTLGVATNLYIFQIITWRSVVSTMIVIWSGYYVAWVLTSVLGFDGKDVIALSVETGVQNVGVAIVMLKLTLDQPTADLTILYPIMADILMPFPPTAIWLVMKCRGKAPSLMGGDLEEEKKNMVVVSPLPPEADEREALGGSGAGEQDEKRTLDLI